MTMIAPMISRVRGVEVWGLPFETGIALTTLRTYVIAVTRMIIYTQLQADFLSIKACNANCTACFAH